MNCPNCGAAMQLIESRRYFQCRHCGTFHFPTTVEADGIRVTGQPAGAPGCPVCRVPMAHALLDDDHPIDFCATCRGMLLPRATFAGVTQKRRAWAATPPAEAVPLNRLELHRELKCPGCGGRFETYPHLGPGSVVIDNCVRCDLVWLDFGEMRQIVDAPGRDRGARHVPRVDDEYVRQGPPGGADDDEDRPLLGRRRRIKDPLGLMIDAMLGD
jgi:Zn-finger nucleic acid-binding protein